MKIAHIATAYQSVVTILDSKLRALDKYDDLDVIVISSGSQEYDLRKPAVRHITVEMSRNIRPLADLKSIWQLYKVFKREKFDIVHSHTTKAGFLTVIAAKMAGIPLIFHTHHGLPFFYMENKKRYWPYRFFDKLACTFRSCLLAQTKKAMPRYIKHMGDESKVLFEGNGVDIEFVKQSAKKQFSQALKDFPGQGVKLVLLSRLEPVKRVDDFLKVVDKLKQEGMEVSCVVAGCGVLEQKLKNQLAAMQLGDCVNMVGFTDRPHGLIATADIVVLCSEKEGIPRAIMEAMALSKPVVATDVLGTQELVVNEKTGFLVPLGDTGTMAEKVKLLVEDISLREKMGAYGLRRVREHFNDIKIVDFLHEFYIRALN